MVRMTNRALPLLLSLILIIGITVSALPAAHAANASNLTALLRYAAQGGDVKLTKDIALTDTLVIPEGADVTLDLNGKKLDRRLDAVREQGSVIRVEAGASLTLKDGTEYSAGVVTGGASLNGGGIYNAGELTVRGGFIRNNRARNGAGIFNCGGATMSVEQNVVT